MSEITRVESFKCPNCGAPIEYDGQGEKTVKCPFCGEPALVPAQLLPKESANRVYSSVDARQRVTRTSSGGAWGVALVPLILILVVIVVIVIIAIISISNTTAKYARLQAPTVAAVVPTRAPTPTTVPTPSPIPPFAQNTLTFGSAGKGPGQMTNPYRVGVDGKGNVYVADYTGGRVQVFNANGKYLSSFTNGDLEYHLDGFAVDRKGIVTMTDHTAMLRFNGLTGEKLNALPVPPGTGVTEVAVGPEGGMAAILYPLRPDGSRLAPESVALYDASGKVLQTLKAPVSERSGSDEMALALAFDGNDNLYIVSASSNEVFVFGPDGKFINRFGSGGNGADQIQSVNFIAIDSQNKVYLSDARGIAIFDATGRFIRRFKIDDGGHGMAFDDNDALWVAQTASITRYTLGR